MSKQFVFIVYYKKINQFRIQGQKYGMGDWQMQKVAIITGGASGIGKAIALEFARSDYQVFLFDKDLDKLNEVINNDLKDFPVSFYCGDVSKSRDVNEGLKKCILEFKQVDVLVSSAAIMKKIPFLEISEKEWMNTIDVNLKGVFLWGQQVAQWMAGNNKKGSIINISCIRSELATSNFSAYVSSKGAVTALTKAMAVELAPYGINVNAIAPGRTFTEGSEKFFQDAERKKRLETLVPCGRLAMPEEIAGVVVFLASDKAKYMTGSTIPVDGGYLIYKE
jgi:NAD(P)-dependent dehydrogenase (short-subunit alcohol dehydrogenase family)